MFSFVKICLELFLIMIASQSFAHEPWLATPQQLQAWKEKPLPELFTTLNPTNMTLIFLTLVAYLLLYLLYNHVQNNLQYLDHYGRKIESKFGNYVPFILRIMLAGTLIIAAFGLIPQVGFPLFSPNLLLPDLHLTDHHWLNWLQVVIALALSLGLYIRLQAIAIIMLTMVATYLYPQNMWLYIGYFIGMGVYLFLEGSGRFAIIETKPLFSKSHYFAKLILQISIGAMFVIGGLFKVFYPNIDIALLTLNKSNTFFIPYDVFTLLMAFVEVNAGILIMLGLFLRMVAILLFIPFFYLSYILNENIFAHLFIYGCLVAFIINGSYERRHP